MTDNDDTKHESMDDERFDAWLQSAAGTYNRVDHPVPREEMWGAIRLGLQEKPGNTELGIEHPKRASVRSVDSPSPIFPRSARPALRFRGPIPRLVAASLLIGLGIGVGYFMRGTASTPMVVEAPVTPSSADSLTLGMRTALTHHLANAEALLVSYRGDASGSNDLGRWAKDVLVTTRLLLDSPAGATSPSRRKLLEDLELVLVQIVRLSMTGEAPADERELIDLSLEQDQLLTRLRTSIPAGSAGGN